MNTIELIHSQMEQFIKVWNLVDEADRWYLLYTKHTEYTELYELVGYDTHTLYTWANMEEISQEMEKEINATLEDVYDKCTSSVGIYKDLCDVEEDK